MPKYVIGLEPWTDALWSEIQPLAEAHFEEVDGGVEPRRPFRLNHETMKALQGFGVLKAVVARHEGRLVGYFTWNVHEDVESEGLLIAMQGGWYVAPRHWGAAVSLFDGAVEELKALGVQCVFPHHRVQGRGSSIGRFFQRRGAKLIQHTYCLWIGD